MSNWKHAGRDAHRTAPKKMDVVMSLLMSAEGDDNRSQGLYLCHEYSSSEAELNGVSLRTSFKKETYDLSLSSIR